MSEAAKALTLADVQGTVLRGYRVNCARHFVLRVTEPAAARAFLGSLVDGSSGMPQITTAEEWCDKPPSFLNVGITHPGLEALGVERGHLQSFPASFQRGATHTKTKTRLGDVGDSDSSNWIEELRDSDAVHVILSLWVTDSDDEMNEVTATLRRSFPGALEEQGALDAATLPSDRNQVHFGYADNISQPRLEGVPPRKCHVADPRPIPTVAVGSVLLGWKTPQGDTLRVDPEELSTNSSFAAFRVLEQDVAGFERFLDEAAAAHGIDRELVAAKICGRWRNGVPLVLSPETPDPARPPSDEERNDFDYVDDRLGLRCPIGSHIRRTHPRSQAVVGGPGSGHTHRIVRRAMPYGPPFDPEHPDTQCRGLIGYFINADFRRQFEFTMSAWVNNPDFLMSDPNDGTDPYNHISGLDVLIGANDRASSSFTFPVLPAAGPTPTNRRLEGFSRFVTTRGGAYVYLPSITALRYLAHLPA
ncbi:MAG: Dyp-type peroxidase [Acidimicrobiales bacterium]